MDRKIRVGAVSYLNTKPLIYGLEQGMMKERVELTFDYPSNIAADLLNDKIDIGLVPVAIIPEMKEYEIVSDYCISSNGEVASVCIFSEVPIKEIRKLLLDYQSKTSIELALILLEEYWKINPVFEAAGLDFQEHIKGTTAAVVIGDRAFEQRKISKYSYDLGAAWKDLTGLPFVFATWVSNKSLPKDFIKDFNVANEFGLMNIDAIVKQNHYDLFDLKKYYTEFINYRLNAENRKGMDKFLMKIGEKSGKQIAF
ncbi:MAG: menaquinone biosynthesis protein [Ferruginibacter sp.]